MSTTILRSRILDMAIHGQLTHSNTEEWENVKLGDVAEVVTGSTPSKVDLSNYGSEYPFYKPGDLIGKYISNSVDGLSSKGYDLSRKLPKNSILVCCIGSLGKCSIITNDGSCNQQINAILPSKKYITEYLFYVIQSAPFIKSMWDKATSTTVTLLNKNKFSEIEVPLPPLSEQRRIVAKVEELLSEVDKIEQAQADITQAATILRSRVLDMAIRGQLVPQDPNEGTADDLLKAIAVQRGKPIIPITDNIPFSIPENWRWVKFNDYIDVRDGTHDTPKYVEKGIPFVTSKNLVKGSIDFSSCRFITNDDYENFNKRSNVEDQDILYAMIGTIGNPVIVKKDRDFAIKNVALFKKRISTTNMFYIYYLLMGMEKQFRSDATGGLQPFVSLKMFREALIPLPPLSEQHRIVAKIEQLFTEIDKLVK